MDTREEKFIVSLLGKDAELKKYYEEHQDLEKKLLGYQHKSYLTPREEIEKKRLQKLKLIGKDKIMEILGRYRPAGRQREAQ
ncbi:MAG: DUF465 domain-containing protein [Candidatus Binatia bacterium]